MTFLSGGSAFLPTISPCCCCCNALALLPGSSGGVVEADASVDVVEDTDDGDEDIVAAAAADDDEMGMESTLCRWMASWMVELWWAWCSRWSEEEARVTGTTEAALKRGTG